MTQFVTIDRATLEQLVAALEMPCDRWSTVQFEIAADAIKAGRAALANAEPAIKRYVPTDIDAEVAAGTLVQTGPMEWRKP